MKKLYMLFLMWLSVPLAFPAASGVTPEWEREQQQLDELKGLREWYAARFKDAMELLPEAQRQGRAFRVRATLENLMVRIWQVYHGEEFAYLLKEYPREGELWTQLYNTINKTRREIPDLMTQRVQERAAQP